MKTKTSVSLSPKTMNVLHKLVAEAIAYGKVYWTSDERRRDRKAWDELGKAGLTKGLRYECEALKPKAIRLVIG